jgi:HAD superfamily hydrolase (TIGR01509 family)
MQDAHPTPPTTHHARGWPKAILYDHDGTLVNSLPVVVAATNAALVAAGFAEQSPEVVVKAMILPTGPRMGFHSGVDDPRIQAELASAFYHHANLRPGLASAYPGIGALVAEVQQRGIGQGVVSNNQGAFVRRVVAALGLDRAFGPVLGEEDVPATKPDPRGLLQAASHLGVAAQACWFVGDAPPDQAAALAAGMRSIGVTWGIHARSEMAGMGFDVLIDEPAELLRLVDRAEKLVELP